VQDEGTGTVEAIDSTGDSASNTDGQQPPADQTPDEETFLAGDENLDPRKLDPSLQPIFKRMQGVYTKRMQEFAEIRDRSAEVDRFYNDPTFAQQAVLNWATQNGYQIIPPNGQAAPTQQATAQGETPAYLIEAFKKNLAPELQWLAEPQAKAMWTAMQGMLDPVLKQQQVHSRQARESEWQKHADALGEVAPGWEEHEDTMGELFDFLQSDALHHPKHGSKLQMLYDLATARAASMKQATQRVASAGKNRVTSSRPVTRQPSVEDEILKADSQRAWEIAKRDALGRYKKAG
jgi:hypothetical protein